MEDAAEQQADADGAREILFVDLDGSLVATDLLSEHLFVLLRRRPWCAAMLPVWLLRGRSGLKAEVARRVAIDPAALPYNEALLGLLRERRASGTTLVLATAAPRAWAEAVAAHLGLFDAVLASEPGRNLKGRGKLEAIRAYCRAQGRDRFGYVGDAAADLPIWAEAGTAYVVAPDGRLLRRLRGIGPAGAVHPVGEPRHPRRAALRALRPRRWAKNVLVFVPIIAAGRLGDPSAVVAATAAFVAFCLAASAVYVLNDLVDLAADRAHPGRRRRPFASGQLPPTWGPPMAAGLLAALALVAPPALPTASMAAIAAYVVLALVYAPLVKGRTSADVLLLAGLSLTRVVAGAAAVDLPVSDRMLGLLTFLLLSLAWARRYEERAEALDAGPAATAGDDGRDRHPPDLRLTEALGPASGYMAALILALSIPSVEAGLIYRSPGWLWPIFPALLAWVGRIWSLTLRRALPGDPITFALGDPPSLALGLVAAACLAAAVLLP